MTPLAIALIVLVAMFLLGLPIFMSLIISSVVAILAGGDILPLSVIHNSLFDGLNLFPLLAIPCFVVAGTLMEFGNITQQIVDVVKQLVGRVYGGLGITTILACTFFAAISGSGPGTVAAVGTILVPAMVRNGYSKDYASAAASSGGTIGILIPPSNPMIIYAILGNLSVTAMFTAGFIPGFIVAFAMIMTAYLLAKRNGFKGDENAAPFNMKFFLRSCGNAGFALATPFIILGSIYLRLGDARGSVRGRHRVGAVRGHRDQPGTQATAHLPGPAGRRDDLRRGAAHRGRVHPVRQDPYL